MIYLDYNATTPVNEQVLQAMLPYFSEKFGNAASTTHPYGWVAKDAVNKATKQVATALGCEEQQVVFTSGSTEAINLAIKGIFELYAPFKGKHIVTCTTEHKAVLDVCAYLEQHHKAEVTYLNVNEEGLVNLEELEQAITEKTVLVSIMHANNETGVIQPIKQISDIVHSKNSIFMSDCTQSIGKVPVDVDELGIDVCCLSGHKFYGPKGIGAIFYRRKQPRVSMTPIIHGGGHQNGLRSGTLNVPLIVGLGEAIELATKNLDTYQKNTATLRNQLEEGLAEFTDIQIIGHKEHRLPNTSNVHFKTKEANKMIELVNGAIAVSTGSACTSATLAHSHVLNAMGFTDDTFSSIRFSLGTYTTQEEIKQTLTILKDRFF